MDDSLVGVKTHPYDVIKMVVASSSSFAVCLDGANEKYKVVPDGSETMEVDKNLEIERGMTEV